MVDIRLGKKIINGIELVIFDKDGTMIDLHRYWSRIAEFRAKSICSQLSLDKKHLHGLISVMGINKNKKLRPEGPVGVKSLPFTLKALRGYLYFNDIDADDKVFLKAIKYANRESLKHFSSMIKPVKGLHKLIGLLKRKGCKIAVATGDATHRAKLAVDHLGLSKAVDFAVGFDKAKKQKPHPSIIEVVLKKLNTDRTNAIMIGDTISDMKMAKNARVKAAIGVGSGVIPLKELGKHTRYTTKDLMGIKIGAEGGS